jgi:hypothetical protein
MDTNLLNTVVGISILAVAGMEHFIVMERVKDEWAQVGRTISMLACCFCVILLATANAFSMTATVLLAIFVPLDALGLGYVTGRIEKRLS